MKVVIDGKEFESIGEQSFKTNQDIRLQVGDTTHILRPVEKYKWIKRAKIDLGYAEPALAMRGIANLQEVLTEIALSAAMNGEVAPMEPKSNARFCVYFLNHTNKLTIDSWGTATHGIFFKTREFAEAVLEHYGERLLKAYQAVYKEAK